MGAGRRPSPHPESVRTYGRSYADVITKFSWLDGLPIFLTHGALLVRFASGSSANKKTPEGVYAGCIGLSKNYVEWWACLIKTRNGEMTKWRNGETVLLKDKSQSCKI